MGKASKVVEQDDGCGPPEPPREVICIHCTNRFQSDRIRWDDEIEMWRCPMPGCDGVGYGVDIHDVPVSSAVGGAA